MKLAEEEIKKEIEALEEGAEIGPVATAPAEAEEEKKEEGKHEAAEKEREEKVETAPAEVKAEEEIEERRRKLKELMETYRDVSSFVKEMRDLGPEERVLVHSIVEKVMTPEKQVEVREVEKPIVIEKPVVKEVEKPVPVMPRSVEAALERIGEVEARLTKHEAALERIAETQKDIAVAVKSLTGYVSENMRLREELRKLREELESFKKQTEQKYMIVPRAEKLSPDGSVIREYDFHPALKALEKRTDFAVEKLGPALIQELRATRSDISSSINRLVSLVEAIITPELRRRAPSLVEDIEKSLRKLVGPLTPVEREKALAELEEKASKLLEEAEKSKGGKK